jgi:hypothetical protein
MRYDSKRCRGHIDLVDQVSLVPGIGDPRPQSSDAQSTSGGPGRIRHGLIGRRLREIACGGEGLGLRERTAGYITLGITTAAVLTGAAVGFADPAWADDPNGAYTITWNDGKPQAAWTFTPCGPDCSHVTSDDDWSTDAHLVNGRWIMGPREYTVQCWNGSTEMNTANDSFDAATLMGTSVVTYPVACPQDPPGGMTIEFSLTKVG